MTKNINMNAIIFNYKWQTPITDVVSSANEIFNHKLTTLSAGVVEYADCTSVEG